MIKKKKKKDEYWVGSHENFSFIMKCWTLYEAVITPIAFSKHKELAITSLKLNGPGFATCEIIS